MSLRCVGSGILEGASTSDASMPINSSRPISPATFGLRGGVLGLGVFSCTSVRQVQQYCDLIVIMLTNHPIDQNDGDPVKNGPSNSGDTRDMDRGII